ncbi:hypothetical protein [Spongiimicrobium salis]|uniref:hypothetical protein n=1 Tax=Spongiimicrobium salis TaxID=1667022 RepID=UPI00374D396F
MKQLLVFFLAITAFYSCSDDEFNAILVEGTAPANLTATIDIPVDNTGTVNVSPAAEGAASFQVFFGESADETPVTVGNNNVASNVYEVAGTYTIRILAMGPTGLVSEEISQTATVSLDEVINIASNFVISEENPNEITVSPTADLAVSFDIFFGDVADEMPTTIAAGESTTHVYPGGGSYDLRIIGRGSRDQTSEVTETVMIEGAAFVPNVVLVNFDEDPAVPVGAFNGATYEIVTNPFLSGSNPTASLVGALTNSGADFEGASIDLTSPVDFGGAEKTITMQMYSEVAVSVRLQANNGVNGERQVEVNAAHTGSGWEMLSFDFNTATNTFLDGNSGFGEPNVPDGQFNQLTVFVDPGGQTTGTFLFDDIELMGSGNDNGGGNTPMPVSILTFDEDPAIPVGAFNGATYEIVTNPFLSGANTAETLVGALTNSGADFEGASIDLTTPVDFGTDAKTISMLMYSEVAVSVRLQANNGVNGERQVEVNAAHTGSGWELLSFDFNTATNTFLDGNSGFGEPNVPDGQFSQLTLFVDPGGQTAGTFLFDDFVLQ